MEGRWSGGRPREKTEGQRVTFRERRGHRGRKTRMKRANRGGKLLSCISTYLFCLLKMLFFDITLHVIMPSALAGTEIILCHVATIRRTVNNGPVREGER